MLSDKLKDLLSSLWILFILISFTAPGNAGGGMKPQKRNNNRYIENNKRKKKRWTRYYSPYYCYSYETYISTSHYKIRKKLHKKRKRYYKYSAFRIGR